MSAVPVLVTFDVDPLPHLDEGLQYALEILARHRISATFFFTGAHATTQQIHSVQAAGHEVGCHGLTHDDEEEYSRLDATRTRALLTQATDRLQQLAGQSIRAFRAPRVKCAAATLRILEELGYHADSSVCSQRLDFVSSNLINPGWLFAPRTPYHPHPDSPYRRGAMRLWEIPVSAMGLPFISTTMRVFGAAFMRRFFSLLYHEAKATGKPIVYLVHPHELAFATTVPFSWSLLKPGTRWRTIGLPIRGWFTRRHLGPAIRAMHEHLFTAMHKRDIRFLTMSQYLAEYCRQPAARAAS